MLEEFVGEIFVDRIFGRKLQRDAHHRQRIGRHPGGAVGLVEPAAERQRLAHVEQADVVEAEEAALKYVAPARVLAVDPPGEVQQQLVKQAFEKLEVADAGRLAVVLVDLQRRPGVHGRVDVVEIPFVGRQLSVRMHEPRLRQQRELRLGEGRIDRR